MKIFVIGLGNILLGDEGFGIHVIQHLKKQKLPDNVEIIDGGTAGFDILYCIKDANRAIFVDVINTNARPGSIYRFDNNSFHLLNSKNFLSLHDICPIETLNINFVVFAVVPKKIGWGMGLTPLLSKKIPKIINLIKKEFAKLQ